MTSTLRAHELHLWRGDRHVLRGVSLSVSSGECLQLAGGNGAGKTTLLRTLCGLMYPEQGRIFWKDADIRADLRSYCDDLVYLGHEPPLKADLTATENLHFWARLRTKVEPDLIRDSLVRVGAQEWADRPARTLSAGQKRRVALAGLSLMAAPLWLLDEPTTNLDRAGQMLVTELLGEHLSCGGLAVTAIHHELPVSGTIRRLELSA